MTVPLMNQPSPTISIITVTLNSAETLGLDCLASVRRQLYPSQHIVGDGASTDGTTFVAKRFLTSIHRSHFLTNPKTGRYVWTDMNRTVGRSI